MKTILLLLSTNTYKAEDFIAAAADLGVHVVVGSDERGALSELVPDSAIELDFNQPEHSLPKIVELAERRNVDAVVAAEDEGALLAALAAERLGLPHNTPNAVRRARYKHLMREALAESGLGSPRFSIFSTADDPRALAVSIDYPTVLKPVMLSASRGVIRADDEDEFVAAFERVRAILEEPDVLERRDEHSGLIMAEDFVPGAEVALEGVMSDGRMRTLAIFDKPDPLDGPFFEETYYITPSRKPVSTLEAVEKCVRETATALGLVHGPVHAELRINESGAWIIEIAPRTIGGLCGRTLRFGAGISLEQLVLRHAAGIDPGDAQREDRAAGVLMLPIPRRGRLSEVRGQSAAEDVAGVEGVTISIPLGQEVLPLPEGHRYLGFVFARGDRPEDVEASLREAHRRLDIAIEP